MHAPAPHLDHARDRALRSPARRRILDILDERGFLATGELRKELGVGWGTLHHHLKRLGEVGLVVVIPVGRRRIVMRPEGRLVPLAALQTRLRTSAGRRIAAVIEASPGLCARDVIAASGQRAWVVYRHLRELRKAGLLVARGPRGCEGLRLAVDLDGPRRAP